MLSLIRGVAVIVGAVAAIFVVGHHIGYFRRLRPPTFAAFLETAGWLILLLVALGVLGGGLNAPGTARVEAASAAVGFVCVAAGWKLRQRAVRRG